MFLCMRTTIHIDDHLFADLMKAAADQGKTLSAVIQDALREWLLRRRATGRPTVELPVFHGTGIMPGVGLNDSGALLDRMKKGDGPA